MSSPAEIVLGQGGASSISVNSAEGQSIVVTPSGGTSVSVASVDSQSVSISSTSTEVTVSSPETQSLSVNTTPFTVEVSTNSNLISGATRLRELTDVIGDPTSGQVLIYNQGENNFQFADQTGGGGGGGDSEELTDYAIQVTNSDGAFDTIIGTTYETNTSMTNILNDILNPYTLTSISLSSLSGTNNLSSFSVSGGQTVAVEVGTSISLTSFSYGVADPSKVKDGSVKLKKDSSSYMAGLSETSTTNVSVSPVINAQKNTPGTDSYKMTAVDNGNPSGVEYNLNSSTSTISWRYVVGLGAYPTIPSSNSTATDIYENLVVSTLINDPGNSSFNLTCTAANANDANHTFLIWPSSYGVIKSVLQNNSTDVTADFVLVGEYTVTNSNNVNISYYIYRTNDTGAFNDDVVLTVTLKDA